MTPCIPRRLPKERLGKGLLPRLSLDLPTDSAPDNRHSLICPGQRWSQCLGKQKATPQSANGAFSNQPRGSAQVVGACRRWLLSGNPCWQLPLGHLCKQESIRVWFLVCRTERRLSPTGETCARGRTPSDSPHPHHSCTRQQPKQQDSPSLPLAPLAPSTEKASHAH